jgi:hypothetical protein
MDYKRIQIDSIAIGVKDVYNIDLSKDDFINTYLTVGHLSSNYDSITNKNTLDYKHNLIVSEKSIGVNTTRNLLNQKPNDSLIVEGNIHCIGNIYANGIILDETIKPTTLSQTIQDFKQILNRLSSHLLFYNTKNYIDNNIYTTHNVIIGCENNATNNSNALKISRHCNNNISNIQLVIQNNDTHSNFPANISFGIIGNIYSSPAHIITSKNMPLHFNINKTYDEINDLYYNNNNLRHFPIYNENNYPLLALDINSSVVINSNSSKQISYKKYFMDLFTISSNIINENPKLYVNGSLYAENIIINDYISKSPKNLDDIYMRQGNLGGLTLLPNQIRGGNFNKDEFTFNSNVYIGTNNNDYKLKIFGDLELTKNLNTNNIITSNISINKNLIVENNGICEFKTDCYFKNNSQFNQINCENALTVKSLTITNSLIYNGNDISVDNLQQNISLTTEIPKLTINKSLNVGGKVTGITDINYNTEIINIYKYNKIEQENKFELYLNDTTIAAYGSKAYIGHCPLNNLLDERDNSLVILTQYNTLWNNIYFYAGKDKTNINNLIPNLAIMENNKIGINTNNPEKTLDIKGDLIVSNYFYREGLKSFKCKIPIIYNNYNNIPDLNINIPENQTSIINSKKLNVVGGINSYNGYFENNYKLVSIKIIDNSSNSIIENTNIGIGINISNSKITMPLQIINTNVNNNKLNNSTITFYRSIDNSKYSGIEFCDDSTNSNIVNMNKWYIYKNHITDDINFVGPLQIGYIKNGYIPRKSCINLYYDNNKYYIDINNSKTYNSADEFNKNKEDMRINGNVKITGDLDIDGSINIKGNYKFNDNNILFSPNPVEKIITKIYSLGNNVYYFDTILTPNHPKQISFLNCNIAADVNININDDILNPNKELNISNSTNNSNISYNNYLLSSNINNDIIIYSNSFTSNNINNVNNSIKTEINNNFQIANNIKNNYFYDNSSINNNDLIQLSLNNKNYAYSNLLISSNIYNNINNIRNIPINSFTSTAINYNNDSLINRNNIITSYNTFNYNPDINVITKLSCNIYTNSLNMYNNALSYNSFLNSTKNTIFTNSYLTNSSNNMNSMSNIYIETNNYNNYLVNTNIEPANYNIIITSNYLYARSNSNNIINNINSANTFISNYTNVIDIIRDQKAQLELNYNNNYSAYKSANNISNILNIPSYISNAILNSNISVINYSSNLIFESHYNNYVNKINNINDIDYNSNIYLTYKDLITTSNNFLNKNYYNNYVIYHDVNLDTTKTIGRENEIYNFTSSNVKYTSNILNITSNIHTTFDNIINDIDSYKNIYIINSNLAYNNYIYTSNTYELLKDNYKNLNYIIDINNIVKSGYSNNLIAYNIYDNVSTQKNKIVIASNLLLTNLNYVINDKTSISNINNICSNFNIIKRDDDIINVLTSNKNYSYDIHLSSMNITSNILFNYSDLYENLSNSINIYDKNNLNIEINKTKSITDKIKVSINTNIDSYLEKSTNNLSLTSNLDNRISSISNEYNEDLNIYRNDEDLKHGIELIIDYLESELITFNNYKENIDNLFANYIIEDYFKEEYENNIMMLNFCINLLNELITNAEDLEYMISNKEIPSILLELTLDITNKYINFINNSYNFAISTSKVVEAINNNVNIYILSSLSIIHLLNTMIEYANIHLEEAWTIISHKIVLFASLSYSLNIIISSSAALSENHSNNNNEGKNTDVLIIGNNIKLYPNKSLIIGYENDYTRWLELINDISKKSVAYFFNSEYNSCISSFNCRAQKFKSSLSSSTSLKTSTSIDINLIDTSIKNYEDSMFDGVSLKLSHIYHRDNTYDANANSNNTIFEIVNKQNLTNPYFSIYSYFNNKNNIFNIGNGDFYDNNNKCISEDTVVHINEDTSKHLLKLSNPSTNPVTLSFVNNNSNNWILSITNKFNFIYNTTNIISINPNGVIINPSTPTENNNIASLYINNTINNSALTLNNNYEEIIENRYMNKNNMNISYNSNGIVYLSKNQDPEDKFDFSKVSFEVNEKILLEDIKYTLSNVNVSFNNINVNNNFKVSINDKGSSNNYVYILPDIRFNDSNISYKNNATKIEVVDFEVGGTMLFTIKYVIPKHITNFTSSLIDYGGSDFNYYIKTVVLETGIPDEKYETIEIDYKIGGFTIKNSIKFYKYGTFTNETLDITIKDYYYTIIRPINIVPKSIYNNNHTNTISKEITNNIINITNELNYLSIIDYKPTFKKTYTESVNRLYPVSIFDNDYNIEIKINVIDKYDVYFTEDNEISTEIEYINVNAKLPTIKQKNIYNNYHNIYSYTDDYEIYFNTKKLLNIDNTGTLTTNGNIHTNNIYLKGDIYNSQGISLYDNILSLINNITNEANYELNSKNIILNPAIGLNDYYKGGVLINGTTINEINNNLFQINNYLTNDNFITLNSCTEKSYIHFNNKIIGPDTRQINSIYRLGSENNIFGIWKYKTLSNYNENYYIDTTIQNNCDKVFDIVPINGTNTFNLNMNGYLNGTLNTNSDIRLKTDIKRIENALDKIMTLQGITYISVENKNKEQNRKTGLIAQEVNQVLPEATSINSDGFYSISYGNLAGLIIEAIKELKIEINELKSRIT